MLHVDRPVLERRLNEALAAAPVTLLLGPRQCGKTTLARAVASRRKARYFDLEDPDSELRAESAS